MIEVYHLDINENNAHLYMKALIMPKEEDIVHFIKMGAYQKVATINSNDLEKGFHLSNSIDGYWGENMEVTLIKQENKSSSVGDLFVLNKNLYLIDSIGFKELNQELINELEQKDSIAIIEKIKINQKFKY